MKQEFFDFGGFFEELPEDEEEAKANRQSIYHVRDLPKEDPILGRHLPRHTRRNRHHQIKRA